jgi:hypothetical protein
VAVLVAVRVVAGVRVSAAYVPATAQSSVAVILGVEAVHPDRIAQIRKKKIIEVTFGIHLRRHNHKSSSTGHYNEGLLMLPFLQFF